MLPGVDEILIANPRRRKRRSRRRMSTSRRRRFSARRRTRSTHVRRRRLRNPRRGGGGMSLSVGSLKHAALPAIIGAGGAMVLDVGMSYVGTYLPDSLKTGWGRTAVQGVGAIALAWLLGKVPFVGRRNAAIMAGGALTVIAYNALRPVVAQAVGDKIPGLGGLADFGDFNGGGRVGAYMNPAPMLNGPRVGAYMRPGVGAYMSQSASDMM